MVIFPQLYPAIGVFAPFLRKGQKSLRVKANEKGTEVFGTDFALYTGCENTGNMGEKGLGDEN